MRLALLTSSDHGIAPACLPELLSSESLCIVAVIHSRGMNPETAWPRRLRRLRKVARIGPIGAANGIRIRSWFSWPSSRSLRELCSAESVPFFAVPYIGSDETARALGDAATDLAVSLGNPYIPQRIFRIPSLGMVNLHSERLPDYQNAQSVIWPIHNGEDRTGLTLHMVDDRIDTGRILHREEFPIRFRPTLEQTVRETLALTRSRAPAAVRHVCENFHALAAQSVEQNGGRSYTTPSARQFLRMVRNNGRLYRRQIALTASPSRGAERGPPAVTHAASIIGRLGRAISLPVPGDAPA